MRHVRNADLFIGIYAERYGSIDHSTGKSVTELEYHEAYRMLSSGRLRGLLLYELDSERADWPVRYVDRDPESQEKLRNFKRIIRSRHTITQFVSPADLPFNVLRDVIRTIGIGEAAFRSREPAQVEQIYHLSRPLGMEFYTEAHADLLRGRAEVTRELVQQVITTPFSLFIGESGAGKTSVVRAGLRPTLRPLGWHSAVARPMDDALLNLRRGFWSQLMRGPLPDEFDLPTVVQAIGAAHESHGVLLVVDQFEDCLGWGPLQDQDVLASALVAAHASCPRNVRMLFVYRADAEGSLGWIWQAISGAPVGLPRVYLSLLGRDAARDGLLVILRSLRIDVETSDYPDIERLVELLQAESAAVGFDSIYPPFIQIVLARIAEASKTESLQAALRDAQDVRQIISDFLVGQLAYLGEGAALGRRVLIALASSRGTKARRTESDLRRATAAAAGDLERCLSDLATLRLIRRTEGECELVHDFLANAILVELASPEEREAKTFRELLAARAASFRVTRGALTVAEHLRIYRVRADISPTRDELALLLLGYLNLTGPVHYWLSQVRPEVALALLKGAEAAASDAWATLWSRSQSRVRPLERSFFLRRALLGETPSFDEVRAACTSWGTRHELAEAIRGVDGSRIDDVLPYVRSRLDVVRHAARQWVFEHVSLRDDEALKRFSRARAAEIVTLLPELGYRRSSEIHAQAARRLLGARRRRDRLLGCGALGALASEPDDWAHLKAIANDQNEATTLRLAAGQALLRTAVARRDVDLVHHVIGDLRDMRHGDLLVELEPGQAGLFSELDPGLPGYDANAILNAWVHAQPAEPSYRQGLSSQYLPWADLDTLAALTSGERISYARARSFARGAAALFERLGDRPMLRAMIDASDSYSLEQSMPLIRALARIGDNADYWYLFIYFTRDRTFEETYTGWFDVVHEISTLATVEHLPELRDLVETKTFWEAPPEPIPESDAERWRIGGAAEVSAQDLHVPRRLVGVAFSRLAEIDDIPMLVAMLEHQYWTIADAARSAVVRLGREEEIVRLTEMAMKKPSQICVQTLCELDAKVHGHRHGY